MINKLTLKIDEIKETLVFENTSNKLVFKEGPLNIRKYRKNGNKIAITSKPNFIAQDIVKVEELLKDYNFISVSFKIFSN